MSDRKRRRGRRNPAQPWDEEAVLAEVRVITDRPCVRAVEDHFAGYFNELGITINLFEEAEDSEVIALRNDLLACLERLFPEDESASTWQVAFWRGLVQVALLFPGDRPIESNMPLVFIHH